MPLLAVFSNSTPSDYTDADEVPCIDALDESKRSLENPNGSGLYLLLCRYAGSDESSTEVMVLLASGPVTLNGFEGEDIVIYLIALGRLQQERLEEGGY